MSREPFITPVTPSFVDNTVAPPGKHVVHLFGGHAPHTLKVGDWTSRKDELVRNVMRVVDEYAPGFSRGIIDMQALTPPDSRRRSARRTAISSGRPAGHIFWAPGAPSPALTMRVFRACPVLDRRLLCG